MLLSHKSNEKLLIYRKKQTTNPKNETHLDKSVNMLPLQITNAVKSTNCASTFKHAQQLQCRNGDKKPLRVLHQTQKV